MATRCVSSTDLYNTVAESSTKTHVEVFKCNHTWTIQNFSFCSIEPGVPLHSQIFGSEVHEGVEWRLNLYPGGKDDESKDNVACYLELVTSSYGDMVAKFNLYILSRNGQKIYHQGNTEPQNFIPTKIIGYDNYVSRQYIFDKGNGFLPDDNLTIYCEIAASPIMPRTMQSSSAEDFITSSFTWVVEAFSLLPNEADKEVASPVFFYPARCKLKWQLLLVPYHWYRTERAWWISLFLCSVSENKTNVTASVKLSLISSKGEKANESWQSLCTFDKKPSRKGHDAFESRKKLLEEANGFLPGDKLTVLCEITYSAMHHDDSSKSELLMPIPACRLSDDLEILFATKKLSDVTLVVGEREIQAHKTVLAARSSVFLAMFEHEMEEQTSNRVEINDIDYEVLNDMLRFMYTGKANNVSDMAAELLKAADKYDLQRLKVICERELFSDLTIENATQMFILAHAHSVEHLKTAVIRFIAKQRVAITQSEDFKSMIESHPRFICELLDRLSSLE